MSPALTLTTLCGAFLCILEASCTIGASEDLAVTTSKSGVTSYKRSRNVVIQGPGGTVSQKGSNGYSIVADNQQSARDIAQAVGGGYAAGQATKARISDNGLSAVNKQQETAQKANAIPPTITTPTVDPVTGQLLTPVVTPAATTIPALPK